MFDGLSLDPFTLLDDGFGPAEVGIGRSHIVQALVVAPMTKHYTTWREARAELYELP